MSSSYLPLDPLSSSNNNEEDEYGENININDSIIINSQDVDGGNNNNNSSSSNINENTNLLANREGGEKISEEDLEEEADLEDFSHMIIAILKPVTITMLLVVWAVRKLSISNNLNSYVGITVYYNESSNDSTGEKIWGSLLNGLIFLVTILFTTVCFVFLYKYRCLKAIYTWLFLSVGVLLAATGGYIFLAILQANNLAIDYITFAFLLLNFSAGGIIAIFWYAPTILNQSYLIIISALMAISFTRLPSWTTWSILAIVSIYDLFAVLCPKGPLRVLVETAQERNETIPALIYNANFDPPPNRVQSPRSTNKSSSNSNNENEPLIEGDSDQQQDGDQPQQSQQQDGQEGQEEDIEIEEVGEQRRSLKLGLGDFVFYSVLLGRAALFDMSTVFTCFVAIVTGLFATLLLLAIFRKALPALPISIAFGILFYFLSSVFLYPFIETLGVYQVFI
ncbi:presenilin family protein [Cavenderia fasciculata]|uniref:Presenilin n=1 Tax=Cavenderia fasciculata TaxID=261658 RepID=F4Q1Y3_CACFS|nr:presenilin family protein [Cavenderia fasciculata]EGG18003.1 presenilin family protein [Cavenderia fasciculata]|eukprot:XP_004356896.1 presenilin family protein [Cavenderia fasciculata]